MRHSFRLLFCGVLSAALALTSGGASAETPDITATGVLGVKTGAPLATARATVKRVKWDFEPNFMVDISADCAEHRGETHFCALVEAAPAYDPKAKIIGFVVLSPKLKAANGVHVGMSIKQASALWGPPTLSFHFADEAREYIRFPKAPKGVSARGGLADAEKGRMIMHFGAYPKEKAQEEYQETQSYRPDTLIGSLWIF